MGLLVKVDEDLSPAVCEPLVTRGYDLRTVVGQGWSGTSDADLWPKIVAEGVFFITADKGFGDVRVYPPGTHPGILVLRPARESIAAYRDLLAETLAAVELRNLTGSVSVASASGLRSRRPETD